MSEFVKIMMSKHWSLWACIGIIVFILELEDIL